MSTLIIGENSIDYELGKKHKYPKRDRIEGRLSAGYLAGVVV